MKNFFLYTLAIFIFLAIPIFTALNIRYYPYQEIAHPTAIQRFLFFLLSFFEAIALETGVLFLILVRPILSDLNNPFKKRTNIICTSLAVLLISWFPHDYFHSHNAMGTNGLLLIEYGFHATSILVTLLIVTEIVLLIQDLIKGLSQETTKKQIDNNNNRFMKAKKRNN